MNIYTVTYGQHPVGIVRAVDAAAAIDFICALCSGHWDIERYRTRQPTDAELSEFVASTAGRTGQEGTVGFLFVR